MLSGYEEDVSFIRDGFTTWLNADFNTILERHAVDVRKALAEFREASARRHDTSAQEYHFDSNVPNRSSATKTGGASTTIQDLDAEERALLRNKSQAKGISSHCRKRLNTLTTSSSRTGFHVTHYGGCAVLFNKDTFFTDVKVKSIYLHDIKRVLPDKVGEGASGVLSRASFRRQPPNGQQTFTVMSLHISNIYAKKRGIGKKLILTIRAVMLDEKGGLGGR